MRRTMMALAAIVAIAAQGAQGPANAQTKIPIFDCHVHYGQNDWGPYPIPKVLALFDAAGVARVCASSTPDDGTVMLHRAAPDRVVPILRPYRTGVNSGNWFNDPNLAEYLEGRLKSGIYRGIGEFHLFDAANAETPQVRRVIALAVERGIFLHVHSGAEPVRALFRIEPKVKVLLAHAGMSEPPEVVGEMIDKYPTLCVELSFRADEIAAGGKLDPRWAALFTKHPDRFVVGTDTYVTSRWDSYEDLIAQHRAYLALLPRDIAEKIAFRNAVKLFGDGGRREFK